MAWRLINAQFEVGAVRVGQFPEHDAVEFAIVGRSNVGKSSLLNALFGTKKLVKTSKAPGRTQELNFFAAELIGDDEQRLPVRFVDLPGYGYAKVSHSQRDAMSERIGTYLSSDRHRMALLLLDLKRPPADLDLGTFDFLCDRGRAEIICTKSDRLKPNARKTRRRAFQSEMGLARPPRVTSATKGSGLPELRNWLAELAIDQGS
jgi:GTP-binding protein